MEGPNPFANLSLGGDPLLARWVEACRKHREEGTDLNSRIRTLLASANDTDQKSELAAGLKLLVEQTAQNDATARSILAEPKSPWARRLMRRGVRNAETFTKFETPGALAQGPDESCRTIAKAT